MAGKLTLLIFAGLTHLVQGQVTRIAFGSCSRQNSEEQLWEEISQLKPQLWIWGGDNIYGDSHDMKVLKSKYDQQKNRASYRKLLATCPVTGTWDDHDYGVNDGGKFYSGKQESKKLALEFLGIPPTHPVNTHEGLYYSYTLGKAPQDVLILNLDTRWFRDTIYKEFYFDSAANRRRYRYLPNETGDILGEAQWRWLEEEIRQSKAALIIINSSIQVISEEHDFEKWSNFPQARQRLFNVIQKYPSKRVLIISGDRHIAEISRIELPALPYPLYDITSSGLTHTWTEAWNERNRHRVGDLVMQKNFGMLEIFWSKNPSVQITIYGKNNVVYLKQQFELPLR
ncbi:MAG: alkaline phosphatase D family protein [Cyclobacteriaceae bacterium]|nr:alkaline phosphatase D family protein [Cyclobacteriaceae bacterium]